MFVSYNPDTLQVTHSVFHGWSKLDLEHGPWIKVPDGVKHHQIEITRGDDGALIVKAGEPPEPIEFTVMTSENVDDILTPPLPPRDLELTRRLLLSHVEKVFQARAADLPGMPAVYFMKYNWAVECIAGEFVAPPLQAEADERGVKVDDLARTIIEKAKERQATLVQLDKDRRYVLSEIAVAKTLDEIDAIAQSFA